jgi:hypothetical protein
VVVQFFHADIAILAMLHALPHHYLAFGAPIVSSFLCRQIFVYNFFERGQSRVL